MNGKLTPRLNGLLCIEQLLALNDASTARWQHLYARYLFFIYFFLRWEEVEMSFCICINGKNTGQIQMN